jgi:hypothetical protein
MIEGTSGDHEAAARSSSIGHAWHYRADIALSYMVATMLLKKCGYTRRGQVLATDSYFECIRGLTTTIPNSKLSYNPGNTWSILCWATYCMIEDNIVPNMKWSLLLEILHLLPI